MKWDRKFWRRYATFAGGLAVTAGGLDVYSHGWPQLGITAGATATTLFFSRRGFKAAAKREAHRPDYAKIARLEIELGLVDPPPPAPPVNATIHNSPSRPVPVTRLHTVKPDVRCAFCIPGRGPTTPNYCPFFPGCQN